MNNQNRNNFRPGQREVDSVTKSARSAGREGAVIGGVGGYLAGNLATRRLRQARLVGIAVGGVAGHVIGKTVGRRAAAKDDIASRKALRDMSALGMLQELNSRLDAVELSQFDRNGNNEPGASGQDPNPYWPRPRGVGKVGDGIDAEQVAKFTPERERLAEIFGHGVVDALDDSELSEENCRALRSAILAEQSKVNDPSAGLRSGEDFERRILSSHLGARTVSEMSDALVHANYLGAVRRGLIQLESQNETTDLAFVNRVRNREGEFEPGGSVDPAAVVRAYSPQARTGKTKTSTKVAAVGAAAGLAGALAHLRGKKSRTPRLGSGGQPTLPGAIGADFATRDDGSHPVRDTLAGVGAGALGVAGLLALRKRRLARLASGLPKLPPRTVDVEAQPSDFAARHMKPSPFGNNPRRLIRRPKRSGKLSVKPLRHNMAFLIQDDDFPLVPQQEQKLPPGMKRRVPLAKSKAEMLKRLRAITALSRRDFGAGGLGKVAAETVIDAVTDNAALAGETPGQKRQRLARIAASQQSQETGEPGDGSLSSALTRAAQFNFGIGSALASPVARDIGVIGAADLGASQINDAINRARERKRRGKLQVRQGIEAQSPAGPTALSLRALLTEFDADGARDRAKRHAATLGATLTGGAAGATAGLLHDQGTPVHPRDLRPGDQIYIRQGPGGLFQHTGVVGTDGNITHRTPGSSTSRAVKPASFVKGGRGPLRRESHADDLPRTKAAENATAAAGTRQGKYSLVGENCQRASSRIASKGTPGSRQLRKAIGGAAAGALAGNVIARYITGGKRKDK